jgi:7,8-dihydro-6-hydroxymethylpterin-pyrophosphokinase
VGRRRIPDPEVLERPFVAIPLAEIAPQYVHPETGQTLQAIAKRFDSKEVGMRRRKDIVLDSYKLVDKQEEYKYHA